MSLDTLPLEELDAACRRETKRYREHGASDGRFCLEIFRRALQIATDSSGAQRYVDEDARTLLVAIYSEYIKAKINLRAIADLSLDVDDLVQQTWLKFWSSANSTLTFVSLPAALAYLELTSRSVFINHGRERGWGHSTTSLPTTLPASGGDLSEHVVKQELDQRIRLLLSYGEYRVYVWRYVLGRPPREIAAILAAKGEQLDGNAPTARRVSMLLERIFKRLADDSEIRAMLQSD